MFSGYNARRPARRNAMFFRTRDMQTALETYQELTRKHGGLWEKEISFWQDENGDPIKERAIEYAVQSLRLSDADPSEIPWKTFYENKELDHLPWVRDFFTNDVAVTEACLWIRPPLNHVLNPSSINSALCRGHGQVRWRTSSDRGVETSIPAGIHGKKMVRMWRHVATLCIRHSNKASALEKQTIAWMLHDAFLFLRPFRDGNGRTARLVIQDLRRELGLLPVFIHYEQREIHRERTKLFNRTLLIPYLQQHFGRVL
jgi:hypothetical protein